MRIKGRGVKGLALLVPALLAGCSMAPAYHPPETVVPPAFKEVAGWTPATPMDAAPRGAWWEAFGDPVLNDLETRAEAANPTLAAALARYDQSRAATKVETASLFPQIGASADASRQRLSGNRPLATGTAATFNDFSVGGSLDYELDLWGRIRNSVNGARGDEAASAADLVSAKLSLQAAVADAYVRLRGLDAQADLLARTVAAYDRAFRLTSTRHDGGIASGIDVNRSRTTLSNARAEVSGIANQRAATEHELAALVGALASDFSVAPHVQALDAPDIAPGTPSELLQRRPDVAAAERRIYAANARIGVARAAFFPRVALGLGGGWETTGGGPLLSVPSSFWGLGPLSAALTLFDGGRRKAQVAISRAEYDELAANYRDTVLTAFRQTEDGIAAMHHLAVQRNDQRDAAQAAQRTSDIALTRYRDGASDYLEVVTAQTAALDAARALLAVEIERMRTSVAMVKALGGTAERPQG